jgi:hypothetical protein
MTQVDLSLQSVLSKFTVIANSNKFRLDQGFVKMKFMKKKKKKKALKAFYTKAEPGESYPLISNSGWRCLHIK